MRAIARAHGGEVEVTGQPGQGTTFVLRIPLVDTDGPVSGGHDDADRPHGDREDLETTRPIPVPETHP